MEKTDHPVIIFDGVCNLCEYSIRFIVKNDRQGTFKFVSAQSERGEALQRLHGVDTLEEGTVILLKGGQVFVKSDAALEIARDLDGYWRYLRVFKILPKPIRDYIYSVLSKYRYQWFGKKDECLLPDEKIKKRFL